MFYRNIKASHFFYRTTKIGCNSADFSSDVIESSPSICRICSSRGLSVGSATLSHDTETSSVIIFDNAHSCGTFVPCWLAAEIKESSRFLAISVTLWPRGDCLLLSPQWLSLWARRLFIKWELFYRFSVSFCSMSEFTMVCSMTGCVRMLMGYDAASCVVVSTFVRLASVSSIFDKLFDVFMETSLSFECFLFFDFLIFPNYP